jgi:antitoxin ParD1/3/4
MNVSLTPELEQYINNQVKTGLYNSSSEVVRAAIRLLVKSETSPANPDYENYKMWLNQEIQIGLDQAARGELIPGNKALKNLQKFRTEQLKSHGKI